MSENVRRSMDSDSDTMAPAIAQENYDANVDYVINEYMDRLGTRLNILETELKYAWRALDLLSQEYIKMWERLEKLEGLLYEQQSVISQLLDFYTSGGASSGRNMGPATAAMLEGRLGELEVIREILGNGTVEDGLEEGLDVTMPRDQSTEIHELELDATMDEMHVPDEAFYRSLNQAYREDLVSCDPVLQGNQLGMIWEEREEVDENSEKKPEMADLDKSSRLGGSQEIYSALDYKDYRGNSPCISEQDIAQLSRIDSIDHVAIEKLNELDRLSNKLHQDSVNIKHLQRKLLESPISVSGIQDKPIDVKQITEKGNIDEKLQQIYSEENWSFTSGIRDKDEMLLLAKSDLPSSLSNPAYATRPNSRLSVTDTDNEVAETLAGGIRTPTSPRRRQVEVVTSCTAPFTTVTGRLAYSAAVQHVESAEAAAAAAIAIQNPKNPFYCGPADLNSLIAASYETVSCSTPNIFSIRSEKAPSPTLSVSSIRTRQDGYIGTDVPQTICPSSSPPPPAPRDVCEPFLLPNNNTLYPSSNNNVFLGTADVASTASSLNQDHGRLGSKPHSPKSPKTSPKRSKSHSSTIVTAKSDSGLSSMSGWSSLEKSPGSPKNGTKAALNYYTDPKHPFNNRPVSPIVSVSMNPRPFMESSVDSKLTDPSQISSNFLPGGHHLSAFTTVKSPCSLETADGYGTFVPAPAPASDINVSPRKKSEQFVRRDNPFSGDYMFRSEQPAIYSVAGSNRDSYTSVYTSNSADYISQTINYPDLVEPYENNEFLTAQQKQFYNSLSSIPSSGPSSEATQARRRSLSRSYSTSKGPESIANHEGYKTAMYRTMFPSGNITDALSYYPTSSRYDSAVANVPQGAYNDPSAWLNYPPESQFPDSTSTSSSMRSVETSDTAYTQSPYTDRRHQHQQNIQQQPIYENQQQIDQHRQWSQRQEIPYLELDLRNRNVPEYVVQQQHGQNKYYAATGVIMTQSGYITISSGTEQTNREEKTKKMKRGNTLKSAMTSVSHWLPDLHLTKRNRSYSLPSGSKKEGIEGGGNISIKSNVSSRKKKKNAIVSTVSGILQKAKRKSHSQQYTQSLSDPEQSENEWTLNRTRSVVSEDERSEDSCSVFSDQFDKDNLFPKISTVKAKKASTNQPAVAEQKSDDESQLQSVFETIPHGSDKNSNKPQMSTDTDVDNEFEEERREGEEEHSGKSTGSGSSNIFPTVGEVKRSSQSEKGEEMINADNKMVVVVGGASMEFAVSRALGKYRQRQSNPMSDELVGDEQNVVIEEIFDDADNLVDENAFSKLLPEQKSTDSSENNKTLTGDEAVISEGSPSTLSLRSHTNRFLPKHQQSLEIPGHKDDDDSRSTHSWRSTSRVSSRRQSTEDSIDSEDEWYCYELRKLEEMERQTQLEQEMGTTLHEEPEPVEEELYEPAEEVKEKMSFVLRELRMKAKVIEGVLDEKDNNLHVLQSAKRRENNRNSFQLDNASSLFAKIKHYHHEDEDREEPKRETETTEPELHIPRDDEEHSSGETSGPDSPHHSTDEYDETEMALNDEFARCHLDKEMTEVGRGAIERGTEAVETPAVMIPKIVEPSTAPDKEELAKEGAQLGSKWKLLKTLKERKAEEKSSQSKAPLEPAVEKDKVSMLDMMQKFYEIHVKT